MLAGLSPVVHAFVVAEILGPDLLVVLAVVLVLFGGSQLPKLARSLGQASHEFRRGVAEGAVEATGDTEPEGETVTLTRSELDALIAEREQRARGPQDGAS